MKQKESQLTIYSDGATARLHNKEIKFIEREEYVMFNFRFIDKNPEQPACWHNSYKGKIRETGIKMSHEAMEALVEAYITYKRNKHKDLMLLKDGSPTVKHEPLSEKESEEMVELHMKYLKDRETNPNAHLLIKYQKYWQYVARQRATESLIIKPKKEGDE